MRKISLLILLSRACLGAVLFLAGAFAPSPSYAIGQVKIVRESFQEGDFRLFDSGSVARIYVDEARELPGVTRAVNDLGEDIQAVTGVLPSTGSLSSRCIVVGTVGKSPIIDNLIASGKLDGADLAGKWESFVIQAISDPAEGMTEWLVIAGSDKRGTIYGVYDLSEQIGVSPWYWWADVTPRQKKGIYIGPGAHKQGEPSVQYRGIFINDEENLAEWSYYNFEKGKHIGPKTYEKIFELLLRLKANYLWPAMHGISDGFNNDPENGRAADLYGIVMGSTHCDMLLRNNENEWRPWASKYAAQTGHTPAYDYTVDKEAILQYWEESIARNKDYEAQWTLGMRGIHDTPFTTLHAATTAEKIAVLEQIFADQRTLLRGYIGNDISRVFQVFIPYKEVLPLYDAELEVPDDVTIMWADDNYGFIRRLSNAAEAQRSGGSGVYYHLSYWGSARSSYMWLNTISPALIQEEMGKALAKGARKVWVVNVGDIKPAEIGIEFFLNYAWNANRWEGRPMREYLAQWAEREFGAQWKEEIADIIARYFQFHTGRKPEHLAEDLFSHVHFGDEAQRRMVQFQQLLEDAEEVYSQIPSSLRDAYYQLVLFKVKGTCLINKEFYYGSRSNLAHDQGRLSSANNFIDLIKEANAAKKAAISYYNKTMSGGKWDRIMDPETYPPPVIPAMPEGSPTLVLGPPTLGVAAEGYEMPSDDMTLDFSSYVREPRFLDVFNKGALSLGWSATADKPWVRLSKTWSTAADEDRVWVDIDWSAVPQGSNTAQIRIAAGTEEKAVRVRVSNQAEPAPVQLEGFIEALGYVSMEAEHFSEKIDRGGASWQVLKDLGRMRGDMVQAGPVAGPAITNNLASSAPELRYKIYFNSSGAFPVEVYRLPTLNARGGVRYALAFDDGTPVVVTGAADVSDDGWDISLYEQIERKTTALRVSQPGYHTLRIWMMDPGVVLDKIVIYTEGKKKSYFGPPESFHPVHNPAPALKPAVHPRPSPAPRQINLTPLWGRGPFLETGGKVAIEAETAHERSDFAYITSRSGATWRLFKLDPGYAIRVPDRGEYWINMSQLDQRNPEAAYGVRFATPGSYNVWLRLRIADQASDSIIVGLDGAYKFVINNIPANKVWAWAKIGRINVASAGLHYLNLWAREDGICLDRIYLTTGDDIPQGGGPQASPRDSAPYSGANQSALYK